MHSENFIRTGIYPRCILNILLILENYRKDAMLESNGLLTYEDISVTNHGLDSKDRCWIKAYCSNKQKPIGFICWDSGKVTFTNFNAKLTRENLDIGRSTKRGNENTAGAHGEGLKIAAMVMTRNGYKVRMESSGCYWNFKITGRNADQFKCNISIIAEDKQMELADKHQRKMAKKDPTPQGLVTKDVTIQIGRVMGKGEKIRRSTFEKWMKISLDLDPPGNSSDLVKTRLGTLILDPKYEGKIYLKGLLMEERGSLRQFKYGYNLKYGRVNRDREMITNIMEQARTITDIWRDGILAKEKLLLTKYVDMLKSSEEYADVDRVESYISDAVAKKIWHEIRYIESDNSSFFYYPLGPSAKSVSE